MISTGACLRVSGGDFKTVYHSKIACDPVWETLRKILQKRVSLHPEKLGKVLSNGTF